LTRDKQECKQTTDRSIAAARTQLSDLGHEAVLWSQSEADRSQDARKWQCQHETTQQLQELLQRRRHKEENAMKNKVIALEQVCQLAITTKL